MASAELDTLWIPKTLAEGAGGFFQAAHNPRPLITVCSSKHCDGSYALLLGSWALDGPAGHMNNDDVVINLPGPNQSYRKLIKGLFDANGQGGGTRSNSRVQSFASAIAEDLPGYDEDNFYMSYRGVDTEYSEDIKGRTGRMPGSAIEIRGYNTNGAPFDGTKKVWEWNPPTDRALRRPNLFLGLPVEAP